MNRKGKGALLYIGILIVVFGGFALTVFTRNPIFIFAVFGFFFLLSILFLPFYFKRFHKEYQRQTSVSHEEVIEDVNSSAGPNKLEYDVQQVKAVIDTWKMASKADIVKGILFVTFFLGCIIGFAVCMTLGYTIYGFIFFGLGFGEILISLVVVKLLERRSLHSIKDYQKVTATVLGSSLSSQSSTGERRKHIMNTTYKVFLKIGNEKRIAYSKTFYELGDKVVVHVDRRNSKRIQIIGKQPDIFELEEQDY